jgi:hypothetical protein
MAVLDQFHSPANQAPIDFGEDTKGLQAFETAWNNNLNRWTNQSIVGNPWSNEYDNDRYYYFNPLVTDIPSPNAVPIPWFAFPNRLLNFFLDPNAPPSEQLSLDQIHELADMGAIEIDGKLTAIGDIQVPQQLCPNNDWSGTLIGYTPTGPRGWLDEYCEWSVLRDENGKLRQVMFSCENPAYWFTLWRVNPDLVVQLYQKYINPNVKREDLYLTDQNGSPVLDPLTGDYAYNPTNKWNSGTKTLPDSGGAMHLTSPPNTLSAEIYLAAAATIPRACGNSDPQTLICCASYGRPRRNSDPTIGQTANQVAVGENVRITLTDPIGLYIQTPDFKQWTVEGHPDRDVSKFWSVERGTAGTVSPGGGNDSILHAVFTVPPDLQPEDILITDQLGNQSPLKWAGQIAQTFQIALRATAIPPPQSSPSQPVPQQARQCVVFLDDTAPNLQPWAVQLLPYEMAMVGSPIDLAPDIKQGTQASMILVVQGGLENAKIEFSPPDGIKVNITKFLPNGPGTPGQTSGGGTQAYVLDLAVAGDAPLGDRAIRVTNLDKQVPPDGLPWLPGMLNVIPKSS